MLILGIDTSGKNGSIALVQFDHASARTLQVVPLEGGTFSAQLIPQISAVLEQHNLTKNNIDGFAVVSGPGSFTGLRVGLAAIKALAEVLQKPIAAVSLLESVARAADKDGQLTAVLDAGRGEVYAGDFGITRRHAAAGEQRLLRQEELASIRDREIVTSDAKIAEFLAQHGSQARYVPYPRADFIARIGYEKIRAGEVISASDLDANYIRRSDAEIKKSSH
ncbi:MAG TPA: tRNA (adenosine(37)-N6)-threonylcarbamoyltransferase complex dimerization subunit type 1 TsaB [Terriglobales bacterium]|nr:tRNA (adenosine(37)-N6)-threonylcarbamoyltransferase complex dimerization subunit type 1 TsaB [Terriglobales bacterium]